MTEVEVKELALHIAGAGSLVIYDRHGNALSLVAALRLARYLQSVNVTISTDHA